MTIAKAQRRHPELSQVSLVHPVDAAGVRLSAGSRGTVVHVFAGGKAYMVEFIAPIHAVLTLEAASVQ